MPDDKFTEVVQILIFSTAILLFLGGVVVFALFTNQKRKLRNQQSLYDLRLRLHRDLHDDVGATLSSIKAYSEILEKNGSNEIISSLIKENAAEMIDRLEVISWATNPQHDNFKSLTDVMLKFSGDITHACKIDLQFEKNGIDDRLIIPGEIRQHIFLIFKEAINNVIKYADASECHIHLFIKNQKFILEIIDNGRGNDGVIKGGGAGFINMNKRATEMHGNIEIDSVTGKGTGIRLSIPFPFKTPNVREPKKVMI